MIITFVLPSITRVGGVRVIFEYADRLGKRGHDVYVVYPFIPPHTFNLIKNMGVNVAIRKAIRSFGDKKTLEKNLKLIRVPVLSSKILNLKIPDGDVVIATSWRTANAVYNLDEKKGEKFHFIQHYEVWELWNCEYCWNKAEQISKKTGERVDLSMLDIDLHTTPHVHKAKKIVDNALKLPLKKITVSSWLKELIEKKLKQKVEEVIVNGINFETFYCKNKTWNEKRIILAPYRDQKWKGAKDAIEAFKLVRKRYADVKFVMFGSVRGKIPSWIEFHENVSDEELRKLYCSADIFVFPSWVEGFGLPPMEAMACKCPTVSTNVGAIPDYAISEKTALIVPPRRYELLAEKIMELLNNEDKLRALSEAGYEYIKQFTWEKALDEFEDIIIKK